LERDTCAQRARPDVVADVVRDATLARTLAQIVADHQAGTAAPGVASFHLVFPGHATPPAVGELYLVPLQGGATVGVQLPTAGMVHAAVVVQPVASPTLFAPGNLSLPEPSGQLVTKGVPAWWKAVNQAAATTGTTTGSASPT